MPDNRLTVGVDLLVEGQTFIDVEEQRRWNVRNTNQFAMVRMALIESGKIHPEWYAIQSGTFQTNADDYLIPEVDLLIPELPALTPDKPRSVWLIGRGQGHDQGFIPYAGARELRVQIGDHSQPACLQAYRFLDTINQAVDVVSGEPNVHLADILYVLRHLVRTQDVWIHLGRILHHLPPPKRHEVVVELGRFLAHAQWRRFTIITPERSKNLEVAKEYRSVKELFDVEELLPLLSKAAGPGHEAYLSREPHYFEAFDEVFTIATIMMRRAT